MGSRELDQFRFTLVFVFLSWASFLVVRSQIQDFSSQMQGCSIQAVDFTHCLKQDSSFSTQLCCKALDQAVQAGFNCLCSLLATSFPALKEPLLLPLPNCYISVPPLTLCQVISPIPVVLPPDIPKDRQDSSMTPKPVLMPPSPPETQSPLNSTRDNNSSAIARQAHADEKAVPQSSLCKERNKTCNGNDRSMIWVRQAWFFSLALHFCILLG